MSSLSCFKAYDVRGKVPADLDPALAHHTGLAFARHFGAGHVVLGRDARASGPELLAALAAGLAAGGAKVSDIGICCTEEIYYASTLRDAAGKLRFDGGIMITGSHNPEDENGLKFVRGNAIPVSGDSGLGDIRDAVAGLLANNAPWTSGAGTPASFRDSYIDFVLAKSGLARGCPGNPPKLLLDAGNGCAGLVAQTLCEKAGFAFTGCNMEPDGTFPNGIPNPLLPEKRDRTAAAVRAARADMGIAWDGDADRCFFYDEDGNFIEGYYIVGLLAEAMLQLHPHAAIIHDPRLYWNTADIIARNQGRAVVSKTGHAFLKERMRAEDAVYGGEMSAHHYFRDFAYCDSGMLPWLMVARLLAADSRTLGEMVHDRMQLFPCSGEINSRVPDARAVLEKVRALYAGTALKEDHIDGLSLEFADWRFNLRSSNTEPLLRLNVEARGNRALMEDKTQELLACIRG